MKKFLAGVVAFGLVASSLSAASVSSIENNGNINGVPSSVVQCSSGGRHVIY
jgi:opacity protein-like surface antigen